MAPEVDEIVQDETAATPTALNEGTEASPVPRKAAAEHADGEGNSLEDDLAAAAPGVKNIGVLLDIDMRVTVELGRTQMKIRDIMNLSAGSVVELGRSPAEPVDILVNGVLLARGEVVVVDEQFSVRINKLLSRNERIRKLI